MVMMTTFILYITPLLYVHANFRCQTMKFEFATMINELNEKRL